MLRKFFSTLSIVVWCLSCQASNVTAYFSYAVFNTPGKGPYVETYLTVSGNSVVFKKEKGKYKGAVQITMTFKQGTEIVKTTSYNLLSPDVADSSNKPNFIDQQRFSLANGKYDYEIFIQDNNSEKKDQFSSKGTIEIKMSTAQIQASDIQLLESYSKSVSPSILTKNGYDLIPYGIDYYPDEMTKLAFYSETYNTDAVMGKDQKFAFVYYIESYETLEKMEGYHAFSKQLASPVNVLMGQFDIKTLPTGNYNLVIEVKDNENKVQSQKKHFFQRRNVVAKIALKDIDAVDPNMTFVSKYKNKDTLKEMIRCLWPISSSSEREWQNNQIASAEESTMQKYIYAFWSNKNEKNPEGEWNKYYEQVRIVDKLFRAGKYPGYYTDRGRVYLQYGAPDARQEVTSEPDSYPYEIWQYYRIKSNDNTQMQTNKKFVFYNRELAGNKYVLIHSEARGEIKDARWQLKLKQRTDFKVNLDDETPKSTPGSAAGDLFTNPR